MPVDSTSLTNAPDGVLETPGTGDSVLAFQARRAQIARRQAQLAQAMRDAAPGYQERPGQMISGHYVAPSWAQNLSSALRPVLEQRAINRQGQQIDADIDRYEADDRRAAIAHAMSRPQGTPEQAGPVDPNNPQELAAHPPTQAQMAGWAQSGAGIPSRKDVIEKIMADIEVNSPIREEAKAERRLDREDVQAFRKSEAEAARTERASARAEALAARAEELRLRLEDRALDRASREQLSREHRGTLLELAAQRRADKIAAKSEPKPGKTLPTGTVKDLGELDERANTLNSLSTSFKTEYSGPVAAAKSKVSPYVPGMDTAAADWWRDYKKQQELIERHSLFGATLTQGEQAAWRAADVNQTMKPDVIQKNLATRAKLADKVAEKALERYGAAGYNVEGLGRVRSTGGASGDFGGAPTVRKFNPATGRLE